MRLFKMNTSMDNYSKNNILGSKHNNTRYIFICK